MEKWPHEPNGNLSLYLDSSQVRDRDNVEFEKQSTSSQ